MKKNVKIKSRYDDKNMRLDYVRRRYNRLIHDYEDYNLFLFVSSEFWSIWRKNGKYKLKKTVGSPVFNGRLLFDRRHYDWELVVVYEVCVCVPRKKMEVIYL